MDKQNCLPDIHISIQQPIRLFIMAERILQASTIEYNKCELAYNSGYNTSVHFLSLRRIMVQLQSLRTVIITGEENYFCCTRFYPLLSKTRS